MAWRSIVVQHRPVLIALGRCMGLTADDAEDAAQNALSAFAAGYGKGKYDRKKGRLRSWLYAIGRHHVLKAMRARGRLARQAGHGQSETDPIANIADSADLQDWWDRQWRRAALRRCLDAVRLESDDRTVRAFELFALTDMPARKVADTLGITENAVWLAKHRVMKRIKELLEQMEDA